MSKGKKRGNVQASFGEAAGDQEGPEIAVKMIIPR